MRRSASGTYPGDMTLTTEDFALVFSKPRGIIIGQILVFGLMPLLAMLIGHAFGGKAESFDPSGRQLGTGNTRIRSLTDLIRAYLVLLSFIISVEKSESGHLKIL